MGRIGVYGGSFNPPHSGHVLAAKEAIRLLSLDKLIVVPACLPPHKRLPEGTPKPEERLYLTKLAFAGVEQAEVSDVEITRQGTSYTVDTLRILRQSYPEDELLLLMGTDMLLSFATWYQSEEITRLAALAVLCRSKEEEGLRAALDNEISALRERFSAKVLQVENSCIEISSTTVRNLIAMDCPGDYLAPEIFAWIRANRCYRSGENWRNLPFDRLMEISLSLHKPQRIAHAIGCCETAGKLAERWGADPEAARRAGILHDVTKALDGKAQLHLCERYGMILTESERQNSKLLHAKTGAAVAKYVFGESEPVCRAIYWHTTGRANMELLEKIIYIADYMEPNRDFEGVELLRRLVWKDLDAALLEGFRMSLEQLRRRGKVIDENSYAAWAYLEKERNAVT